MHHFAIIFKTQRRKSEEKRYFGGRWFAAPESPLSLQSKLRGSDIALYHFELNCAAPSQAKDEKMFSIRMYYANLPPSTKEKGLYPGTK